MAQAEGIIIYFALYIELWNYFEIFTACASKHNIRSFQNCWNCPTGRYDLPDFQYYPAYLTCRHGSVLFGQYCGYLNRLDGVELVFVDVCNDVHFVPMVQITNISHVINNKKFVKTDISLVPDAQLMQSIKHFLVEGYFVCHLVWQLVGGVVHTTVYLSKDSNRGKLLTFQSRSGD